MKQRGFICNSQLAVPCTPFQRCCPQPAHTTGTCALLGALPWGRAGPSHVGPRLLAATAPNQALGDWCAAPHHGLPITSTSSPPFSHSESASPSTGLVPVVPGCAVPVPRAATLTSNLLVLPNRATAPSASPRCFLCKVTRAPNPPWHEDGNSCGLADGLQKGRGDLKP